jgi:hypothetical protein
MEGRRFNSQSSGRTNMTRYNGFTLRNSIAAALCALLFSTTCIVAAVGPANAAPHAHQTPVATPLA